MGQYTEEAKGITGATVRLIIFAVIILIVGAVFTFGGLGISWFSKPLEAKIQNKTFQESQAYNESMQRDLENIRIDYAGATPEKKAALRAVAIHRFAMYKNELPPDLYQFYSQLEQGQ